jgi:hypothetical protein
LSDRIRRELVQLHAVDEKEPTKKFMGRKREATEHEVEKHYPPNFIGTGFHRVAGDLGLRRGREHPVFAELA